MENTNESKKKLIPLETLLDDVDNLAAFLFKQHQLEKQWDLLKTNKLPSLALYPSLLLWNLEFKRNQQNFLTYLKNLKKEEQYACEMIPMTLYLNELKNELELPTNKLNFTEYKNVLIEKIKSEIPKIKV